MILAAGLATDMRPVSDSVPKPLVQVAGRALVDHVLDRLVAADVERAVVNLHDRPDQIRDHLADRRDIDIHFIEEEILLDTGGAVINALEFLGPDPFWIVNADSLWFEGPTPALARMAAAWRDDRMDALLLIIAAPQAMGMEGRGDFFAEPDGLLSRFGDQMAPYYYTGVQLAHGRLFDDCRPEPISLNPIWDRAIVRRRVHGLVHDGIWCHVGTPAALAEIQKDLEDPDLRFLGRRD